MTIAPGDVVRVTAKMTMAGQDIRNVYHIRHNDSSPVSDQDLSDSVGGWLDGAYGRFSGAISDELTWDTIEIINVTQDVFISEEAWPVLTVGGAIEKSEPLQIAAVCRFPTSRLGSQGRKFIAGLTEALLEENGELTTTMLTALALYAADILTGVTADAQVFETGVYNVLLVRFAEFVSSIVNVIAGTQRRRQVGVGS